MSSDAARAPDAPVGYHTQGNGHRLDGYEKIYSADVDREVRRTREPQWSPGSGSRGTPRWKFFARMRRNNGPSSARNPTIADARDAMVGEFRAWTELAEQGELCAYTCLGLCQGRDPYGENAISLIPTLIGLLALQVFVPALILCYHLRRFNSFARNTELEFRIIGFIMYLYSIRNMYHNCLDECRHRYLQLGFHYNFDWQYIWPALLGEIVNAFAACTLSVTLFTVFCYCEHPQDLIINCVAINFLGSVDTEFTDFALRQVAFDNFKHVMTPFLHLREPIQEESWLREKVELVTNYALVAVRLFGTLGMGTLLATVFFFSHEEKICRLMTLLAATPLCGDID